MSIPAVTYAYLCDPVMGICPELSAMPSTVVDALNPVGLIYVSEDVFKDASQYALALAIAHFYVLGQMKGSGPVTSASVGDLSTAFAALPTDQGALRMTSYGQRLRDLGRMLRPGGVWAGGGPPMPPPFGGYQPTWPEDRSRP